MKSVEKFIRKNALKTKIESHFKKHPKSKTLLVTSSVGGNKVLWKVQREGKKYKITEVTSTKSEYVLEAPMGAPGSPGALGGGPAPVASPAQPGQMGVKQAQGQNLNAFKSQDLSGQMSMLQSGVVPVTGQTLSAVFMHLIDKQALNMVPEIRKLFSTLGPRATDPHSKQILGSFNGVLTLLGDQGKGMGGLGGLVAHNAKKGKVVREATRDEMNPQPQLEPKMPQLAKNPPSDDEVDDEVGLENEPEAEETPEKQEPVRQKSEEEFALQKNLTGQTIRNANVELDANGGSLTLDLVNTKIPAELKWSNTGEVTFNFKDRPYTIRRGE